MPLLIGLNCGPGAPVTAAPGNFRRYPKAAIGYNLPWREEQAMRPKVGIIGGGVMGTTHGKTIHFCLKSGLVDGELVGIAETDPERLAAFAQASGARLATQDAEELIDSPDINTVYICTPTFNHVELAQKVLARGKALFCEKPLAFNARDAASMRDAAKRAGVTHQVGLVMRFAPVVSVTRDLIRDPASGRAMTCSMIDDQFFPIQGHYASTWRGDVTKVGAGTLLEHAIHDVDILVSYFGRVTRVFGVTRFFFEKEGVEDVSSAILEFESGAIVNHTSIWHNLLHRGSSRRMHVVCENAQYSWEDDDYAGAIRCETNTTGGRTDIPSAEVVARFVESAGITDQRLKDAVIPHNLGQAYLLEDYTFLKAVSEDRQSWLDFDVALYAHRVVDAIYESASTGLPVALA
jgi:predicted dehydrogenase